MEEVDTKSKKSVIDMSDDEAMDVDDVEMELSEYDMPALHSATENK
jgi:hypothetical protein